MTDTKNTTEDKRDLNEEEFKLTIDEVKAKMKIENDMLKSQRKAGLTWNIIFFVGIISTTLTVSLISKLDTFNISELIKSISVDKLGIFTSLAGLIISFLIGILGSYYKTKSLKSETDFKVHEFIKESYLNRIDKSNLNPQR